MSLGLKSSESSSFRDGVYSLTKQIPKGKVTTYGLIAEALGRPRASRAVGVALKINPNPIVTPCHRVVKSDGRIGGYRGGVEKKVKLLISEGIVVQDGKLVELERVLFKDFRVGK